ncbi:sugar ABC transporter ATP-binding protein [Williamsia soli]|uniref:sugar ABC transporter ATP-binding protein n=1 Tax=Williamsia soli TaxID=364929 RepID=UPI001A9F86C7|nr:sugar ABC transporter ATP-binding protein [Williamsia soli]
MPQQLTNPVRSQDESTSSQTSGDPAVVLEALGLVKRFGVNTALDDVSIKLHTGEIHGIAGENGSGKSTLLACLSGALRPDAGAVELRGVEQQWRSVRAANQQGVSIVSQELTLVPQMSIAANIVMAMPRCSATFTLSQRQTAKLAAPFMELVGLTEPPHRLVDGLPIHLQQLVEIARALSSHPTVLLMDEPTSSLERHEAESVLDLARALADDGMSIAFISHRMPELIEYADRVTVLRDGFRVADRKPGQAWDGEWVTHAMVGRSIDLSRRAGAGPDTETVLKIEKLSDRDGFVKEVDLHVREGEIVGLAGLVGAGRTELLETVYGMRKRASGSVAVDGVPVSGSTRTVMSHGIRLVPDDRLGKALIPEMTIAENIDLDGLLNGKLLNPGRRRTAARAAVAEHHISAASVDLSVAMLSGGNQQKTIFARQLASNPRVLLLDEPTRGIDVGAKAAIYELLRDLASQGLSILVASSELEELIQLCHRVYVMFEGQVVQQLSDNELTEDRIAAAATGLAS